MNRRRGTAAVVTVTVAVGVALAGCGGDDSNSSSDDTTTTIAAVPEATTTTTAPDAPDTTTSTTEPEVVGDPALRDELVAMMDEDQAERSGASTANGDGARAERLKAIIAEHGWPTRSLVGTAGATAAWVIALHADHDVDFQQEALGLLAPLVDADEADPTEHAYLVDRVAVNTGADQTYGTQIRCQDGEPAPATPIADEATVDDRRAEVDLDPLADYYDELAEACAAET